MATSIAPRTANIEDILNHIRRIRELTGEAAGKSYVGVSGETAKKLDIEICTKIYDLILALEKVADLETTKKFFVRLS